MLRRFRRAARPLREGVSIATRSAREGDRRRAARALVCGVVNAGQVAVGSAIRRRRCPCCDWEGVGFLWTSNEHSTTPGARCPSCNSSQRHRALAVALPDLVDGPSSILHFAPEAQLRPGLEALAGTSGYRTTDRYRDDVDLPGLDIQALDLGDDSFDVILCNHVLEHVADDVAAVGELARVVRPGGTAILTIPGDWDGRPTRMFTEVDRNGHFRHYGDDVAALLEEAFDAVERIPGSATTVEWRRFGIVADEPIFACRVSET
jgi:hypothetical protein